MRRRLPLDAVESLDVSLGHRHAMTVIVGDSQYLVKFASKYAHLTPKDVVELFKKLKKDVSELSSAGLDDRLRQAVVEKVIKADIAESFVEVQFHPSDRAIRPTSVHVLNLDRDYVLIVSDGAVMAVDLQLKYIDVEPRSQAADARWNVGEITESYAREGVEVNEKMVEEVKEAIRSAEQKAGRPVRVSA